MHITRPLVFFIMISSVSGFAAVPQWQQDMDKRAKELEALQQKNAVTTGNGQLKRVDFPTTIADVPFAERIQIEKEGLEPFKDLKAYREINVKNAAEWCSDGTHDNSTECWEYRCSVGGPNADTDVCISWRCKKPDYYEQNKQECDMHKYCAKDPKSDECMKYKCYETDEKDSTDCQKWLCDHDATFKAENEALCDSFKPSSTPDPVEPTDPADPVDPVDPNPEPGTACTSTDANATRAEYDAEGKCIIKECKTGFILNETDNKCDEEGKYVAQVRFRSPMKRRSRTGRVGFDGDGCFAKCGESISDNLNNKALYPVMGKYYCASEDYFGLLVENDNRTTPLKMTEKQLTQVEQLIQSKVADNDKCEGHWWRNIIMFVGTLAPDGSFSEDHETYLDD